MWLWRNRGSQQQRSTIVVVVATKECSCCLDRSPVRDFPDLHMDIAGADKEHWHEPKVCKKCVHNWARECSNGKNGASVTCPGTGCGREVTTAALQHAGVPKELIDKLGDNQLKKWLHAEPNFRWCAHPGCGSGQLHHDGCFMTCCACKRRTCPTHRMVFHDGQTCAEFDAALEDSSAAQKDMVWIQQNTKQCPKCGQGIEKNGGCDVMTCRTPGCGYRFCWQCKVDIEKVISGDNSAHKPTCTYYRPPEEAQPRQRVHRHA